MRAIVHGVVLVGLVLGGTGVARAVDRARDESGVERAVKAWNLSGKGVLVALIDRGLDITHPAFRNADGTTRVVGMLDLTDDRGATAETNPYRFGTIYTEEQLNAALANEQPPPGADEEGRGTASAGIAAGNGAGSPKRVHRGVAPQADLLFVRLLADPSPWDPAKAEIEQRFIDRVPTNIGKPLPEVQPTDPDAPAPKKEPQGPDPEKSTIQDGQAFFGIQRLETALDYCAAQAQARNKPCVVILNFGRIGGPTDGTSKLCRHIDTLTGSGKPGLVIVTASGDKGDRENRTKGIVKDDEVTELWIDKEATGEVVVEVWYPGIDRVDVRITTTTDTHGPYKAPEWALGTYEQEFQLYHFAAVRSTHRPASGKRQIRVDLIRGPGRYLIELYGAVIKTPGGAPFDAFVSPNPENPLHEPFNRFVKANDPKHEDQEYKDPETVGLHGTIWDGATAKHAVVATSYVHRDEWKNIQGQDLLQVSEGKRGAIWRGSGRGPTADGRPGVTIAVPSDRIITTYARKSEWSSVRRNLISDEQGALYGLSSGTSAAAAFLGGVVALMLERNPTLDAVQVHDALRTTARTDEHTGKALPNRTWGHGKLDAYAAIQKVTPR